MRLHRKQRIFLLPSPGEGGGEEGEERLRKQLQKENRQNDYLKHIRIYFESDTVWKQFVEGRKSDTVLSRPMCVVRLGYGPLTDGSSHPPRWSYN